MKVTKEMHAILVHKEKHNPTLQHSNSNKYFFSKISNKNQKRSDIYFLIEFKLINCFSI